jgi:hypothetical protein
MPLKKWGRDTDWESDKEQWTDEVFKHFFSPMIPKKVNLVPRIKDDCDTARFDFVTHEVTMSEKFLDQLVDEGGLDLETAFKGVLKHEWGHYIYYPRESSHLMFISHFASGAFKEFSDSITAYYMDIRDNLPQILKEKRGREVRGLYQGMNTLCEKGLRLTDEQRTMLETQGYDADEIVHTARKYSVDRLLTAYYQKQSGEDLGVVFDKEDAFLEEKLEELMACDYTKDEAELMNFVQFGSVITEVLKKLKEELPKPPPQSRKQGQSRQQSGQEGGEPNQDDSDSTGEGLQGIIDSLLKPMIGDAPKLGDFTREQLEEGLDEIAKRYKKQKYEAIRDFVESETGHSFDQPKVSNPMGGIGLERSNLTMNDKHIPYYKRLASTYGLYVHKKPLVVDVFNMFPEGQTRFRVGDPVKRLNPFSTGGVILPGITRRYKVKSGSRQDTQYRVPNLTIWIDSSGSMDDPATRMAPGVLAAYIVARTYHENEAQVGVVNFSGDSAFLFPTYEIEQVYSMLTAYWGGGTVVNVKKVKEYMERIAKNEGEVFPVYTTERDYEMMISDLAPDRRKEFIDKNLTVDLSSKVQETYEKMDTIMITDGGIFNIEEVVGYMNETAEYTRNVIFLIDAYGLAKEWMEMDLPNTQIVPVKKASDLIGVSIGEVKRVMTNGGD